MKTKYQIIKADCVLGTWICDNLNLEQAKNLIKELGDNYFYESM